MKSNLALWFIAGVLVAINLTLIASAKRIEARISQGNSFYLCVELWKLDRADTACDRIIQDRRP